MNKFEIIDEYEEIDSFNEECNCYLYKCVVLRGPKSDIGDEILVVQRIEKAYAYKFIKAIVGNKIYAQKSSDWTRTGKYNVDWEFVGASTGFDRTTAIIVLVVSIFCSLSNK